ncbi:MAG: tetratricopeptide repeat protein [Candidatus Aminicenantes bacterium]|nr:tetratricopeptide repeat protein [Candidatus Aminicenantes bacterium]
MTSQKDFDKHEALMRRYLEEGNHLEALTHAFESLKIAETLFPAADGRTGACIINIAIIHYTIGNYKEAEAYYRRALDVIEKWGGSENPFLCPALDNLGQLLYDVGRLAETEILLLRSLKIKHANYGALHPEIARSLHLLGYLYRKQGRFNEAEARFQQAIATWKNLEADPHLEIAQSILELAETYRLTGNYPQAETYLYRGVELLLQVLPHDDFRLIPFYINLGALHHGKGEYKKSLGYYGKALDTHTQNFGETNLQAIQRMSDYARAFKSLAEFDKAQLVHIQIITLWDQILKTDHLEKTPAYSDMAINAMYLGDFEQAELQQRKALKIKRDNLGPNHIEVALSLETLANIFFRHEDYENAGALQEKALAILEQTTEPGSPLLIRNYDATAKLCRHLGQLKVAEKLYKKAIAACNAAQKPDPDALALVSGNLGRLYRYNHNYIKAEEYIKLALQTREDKISTLHPDNVLPLLDLAAIKVIRGDYPGVISTFKEIMAIQDHCIDMIFSFAAQEQKIAFIDNLSATYSACLSFIHKNAATDPQALNFGLETVFQRKGTVIGAECRTVEAILPLLAEPALQDWLSRSAKLSRLAQLTLDIAPEVIANTSDRKKDIAKLREEIAELEGNLKTICPPMARLLWRPAFTAISTAEAARLLPKNTALLEFVKIRDFDFENNDDPWGLIRYTVFILKRDGRVKYIDLGRAFDIDQTITQAIQNIRSSVTVPDHILNRLYTLLWAPLEKELKGIDKVVISPDSLLHLAPFAALPDKTRTLLVERFTITYVASGRQLAPSFPGNPVGPDVLVLAAGADFDYQEVLPLKPDKAGPKEATFWFKPLPGTLQEAAEIPPLIPGDAGQKKIITKDKATETALLDIQNPRILHIATHGFSLPDRIDNFFPQVNGLSRGIYTLTQLGFAFAGANHANIPAGNDTGLLTALDISGLELPGTELVVLSSFNTGSGDTAACEEIAALKQVFAITGAKNLVIGLWPLNDTYTLKHMIEFYKNLRLMPPAEALRQAQLTIIKELKINEGYAGENLWAPYIIQGG